VTFADVLTKGVDPLGRMTGTSPAATLSFDLQLLAYNPTAADVWNDRTDGDEREDGLPTAEYTLDCAAELLVAVVYSLPVFCIEIILTSVHFCTRHIIKLP